MSDTPISSGIEGATPEEIRSALFAQLIMQQANMAMMLLGKVPHPESGETVRDVEAARLFIDQLEMLEAKTKGNLTREESGLLKQSLMSLRLAFVEAVEPSQPKEAAINQPQPPPTPPGQPAKPGLASEQTPTAAEEHRKKFSKKY